MDRRALHGLAAQADLGGAHPRERELLVDARCVAIGAHGLDDLDLLRSDLGGTAPGHQREPAREHQRDACPAPSWPAMSTTEGSSRTERKVGHGAVE